MRASQAQFVDSKRDGEKERLIVIEEYCSTYRNTGDSDTRTTVAFLLINAASAALLIAIRCYALVCATEFR
jgi:hypothetical protein